MRCAVGLAVHTGWAACVIAGGGFERPRIELREHFELLGDLDRFVFHRAAEMRPDAAKAFVARAARDARAAALSALRQATAGRELLACAIIGRTDPMPPLAEVVLSHPMMHTAEGMFYRDALREAAKAAGLDVRIVSPKALDTKDARLAAVGRAVGKPWNADYKLATLAAWSVLGRKTAKS